MMLPRRRPPLLITEPRSNKIAYKNQLVRQGREDRPAQGLGPRNNVVSYMSADAQDEYRASKKSLLNNCTRLCTWPVQK